MSSEGKEISVQIAQVRLDGGTQLREKIDHALTRDYAEQMEAGAAFPRATVFFDGHDYWLADGFHRLEARRFLGQETLDCLVYEGTRREAVLVAVKANATHGLRRTNADKRRAVKAILADDEWSQKSSRWIAETCGVSRFLVDGIRIELAENANSPIEGDSARLGQDGKRRPAHRTADRPAADDADGAASDLIDAALRCGEAFDACLDHLRCVAAEADQLARGPGGRFLSRLHLKDFREHLRQAADAISATRPQHRCGDCQGFGCERCAEAGWLCQATQWAC